MGTENPNNLQLKKKVDFYKKNLTATKNLINYFSKKQRDKRLILIGSSQMYGDKKNDEIVKMNNPAIASGVEI